MRLSTRPGPLRKLPIPIPIVIGFIDLRTLVQCTSSSSGDDLRRIATAANLIALAQTRRTAGWWECAKAVLERNRL